MLKRYNDYAENECKLNIMLFVNMVSVDSLNRIRKEKIHLPQALKQATMNLTRSALSIV